MLPNKPLMPIESLSTNQSQMPSPSSSQNYNPYKNNHNNLENSYYPNQLKSDTPTQSPPWSLSPPPWTKTLQPTLLLNQSPSKTPSKPPWKLIRPPKPNLTVISTPWFQKSLPSEPPTNKNQKLKKLPWLTTKTKLLL